MSAMPGLAWPSLTRSRGSSSTTSLRNSWAWRRHEERAALAPSSQPDAVIRLETGERPPLTAKVIEGAGTAIGRDGMPLPVVQGSMVPPGSRLYGGPFVLH